MQLKKTLRISLEVYNSMQFIKTQGEYKTMADLFAKALTVFENMYSPSDYPDKANYRTTPSPHPWYYPTNERTICVYEDEKNSLILLSGNFPGSLHMMADRVLINFQNSIEDFEIPGCVRVKWMDPDNLEWMKHLPKEL